MSWMESNGGNGSSWNTSATATGVGPTGGDTAGVVVGDRPDIICRKDCPEEKQAGQDGQNSSFSSKCFNCGEEGHTKADCTNPRVESRTCNHCQGEGHIAKDCPTKPPVSCNNCKQEGHTRADCKNDRAMDWTGVPDKSPEEAWAMLETASAERDLFDFKAAVMVYVKALPDTTYKDLEEAFRASNFNVYLIAIEKEVITTNTLMNLQGKIDCRYAVTYQFSANPRRESERAAWPLSPEENLARLEDAGTVTDRHIPMCSNCEQLGHISKSCPEEKRAPVRPEIKCVNCDEVGHRARDCPQERKQETSNNCRNCNQPGHKAADCTEPRSAEGVECKRCKEVGHFAKDCPNSTGGGWTCRNCGQEGHKAGDCTEPKNMDLVNCRNCEQTGHYSKDCPQPKDWSKVTCNNCGQKGHTVKRCKEPIKETEDADAAGPGDGAWGEPSGGVTLPAASSGGDSW